MSRPATCKWRLRRNDQYTGCFDSKAQAADAASNGWRPTPSRPPGVRLRGAALGAKGFTITGEIRCPIHRISGEARAYSVSDYALPARIKMLCRGEGDAASCTVSYDDCPKSVLEGTPPPKKPVTHRVKNVKLSEVTRGLDNSGRWNTAIDWDGKEGWDGNKRVREGFQIHIWDDHGDEQPSFHYDGRAFARPYPRAEPTLDSNGWHMDISTPELTKIAAIISRAVADVGVRGHGWDMTSEKLKTAPPIRVGGQTVDWSR